MPRHLIIILTLNLSVCIGLSYVYDFPQALEDPLIIALKADTFKIEYLYSVYALPNLIMAPVSGYFIEKVDAPMSGMIFGILILIGHSLSFHSVYSGNLIWSVIGRGLYGIGGEGLYILQATVNEYWFSGSLLSLSNALCQVVNNLSVMLGNYFTPLFFDKSRTLTFPLFIGACTCAASCFVTILYYWAHNRYNKLHKSWTEELDYNPDNKEVLEYFALVKQNKNHKIQFGFRSIRYFNSTLWMLCGVYLTLINSIVQFTNQATDIVTNRFNFTYDEAKYLRFFLRSPL